MGLGLLMLLTVEANTEYPDWRDWAVIGLGVVGGGMVIGGAFVTAPIWGTAIIVAGGIVFTVGIGSVNWDILDDSDEPEICSRCNVIYKRGTTHYCIFDYPDAEPLDNPRKKKAGP